MRRVKPYQSPFIAEAGQAKYTPLRWTLGRFKADNGYSYVDTPCEYMNDEFCVHRMVGTKGFTISYAPLGFRIASRDRVCRTLPWAKSLAEQLYPISNNWGAYADGSWPFPDQTVKIWNYIFDVAELQGAFLSELISPGDAIRHKPELHW